MFSFNINNIKDQTFFYSASNIIEYYFFYPFLFSIISAFLREMPVNFTTSHHDFLALSSNYVFFIILGSFCIMHSRNHRPYWNQNQIWRLF